MNRPLLPVIRSRIARWSTLGLVVATGLLVPAVAAPSPARANPAGTGLIITETRTDSFAPFPGETRGLFVELYNPTDSAVDLTGWSLMHTGGFLSSGTSCLDDPPMPLAGTVAAHSYFLFTTASQAAYLSVTPDFVSPTDASFAGDTESQTWILADTTTNFFRRGNLAGDVPTPHVVDAVGVGALGAAPCAWEQSFSQATRYGVHRSACADTNDNAADFVNSKKPSPTSSTSLVQSCPLPSCDGYEGTIFASGPTVTGTADADVIIGTGDADTIDGGGGQDIICGLGGDDVITTGGSLAQVYGGPGDDQIDGANGFDILRGGAGDDTLITDAADTGRDTLIGGPGLDTINAGGGDDTISGGLGVDDIDGGGGVDTVNGNAGSDLVQGSAGDDVLTGGPDDDTINGGDDDDTIRGSAGGDELNGDNGNDRLIGGDDDDTLNGDDGDDRLNGGPGTDTLDGGAGHNILVP